MPLEVTLNWGRITEKLASMAPLFEPNSTHGYHAITFGWLAGELVRRVTGLSVGEFVRREMADPLAAEMYIGIPDELQARVAHIMAHPIPSFPPEIARIMNDRGGPGTLGDKALSLLGAYGPGVFNKPDVRAAQVPGANGISNARSLATIYAACVGEVNGVRLLNEETVARATASQTPKKTPCLRWASWCIRSARLWRVLEVSDTTAPADHVRSPNRRVNLVSPTS